MWPLLYLPKGKSKYEKLDYAETDLSALFRELSEQQFSGSVEIVSPSQRGMFVWHVGNLHEAFYDGDDERSLSREEVLQHFLQKKKNDPDTVINVTELGPQLIESLSALAIKPPMYRELETSFIDMARLFDTLSAKRFLGVLRFYHIRSHTRLGNILIKMNKITRDQLQQAVRLQLSHQGALRLGDALVQIGAIEPKDLGSALDLQSHARKGSDIELALAVFWEGKLLGGYTHIHKQFKIDRDDILPQLVGTEVLMDMLEGQLSEPLDIEFLWRAAEHQAPEAVEKTHQAALHPETGPSQERRLHIDENLSLKADDLILDIALDPLDETGDFLTMDYEEEKVPPVKAPARPAIPPMTVKPPVSAPLPTSAPKPAASGVEPSKPVSAANPPAAALPAPVLPKAEAPPKVKAVPPQAAVGPAGVPKPVAPPTLAKPVESKPEPVVPPVVVTPPVSEPIPVPEPVVHAETEVPVSLTPESTAEAVDEPMPPAPVHAEIAPDILGVEYALRVARDYMGVFGVTLLKKEASPLPLQGREWPENQIRDLVQRFLRSSALLLGRTQSEAMHLKMRERIEV